MTISDPTLHLHEFAPVSLERWRASAEKTLGASLHEVTAHLDGIEIPPLRADDDRPPGARALWDRGGWAVAMELDHARDPAALAHTIREGAAAGLQVAWVRLDGASRAGCRIEAASSGIVLDSADALRPVALAAAETGVSVVLQPDAVAPILFKNWRECVPDLAGLGGVVVDPLGSLAELGARGTSLADAYGTLAATTRAAIEAGSPCATMLGDGVPYHDAGATPPVALGAAIAAALSHVRGLAAHGLPAVDVAPRLGLRLAVGRDLFVGIATLRAARLLWSACLRRLGAPPDAVRIWARTSWRDTSRLDLPVNLLRHTLQAFAASVGGVEHLCVQPHTEACGESDADARRWAMGVQHLLRGESRLDRVADPAAGSAHVEWLTRQIAESAWAVAQRLAGPDPEAALVQALRTGAPPLQREVSGAPPLVGVDLFPDPLDPAEYEHRDVGPSGTGSPVVSVPPLRRERIAARHEEARERARDAVEDAR